MFDDKFEERQVFRKANLTYQCQASPANHALAHIPTTSVP